MFTEKTKIDKNRNEDSTTQFARAHSALMVAALSQHAAPAGVLMAWLHVEKVRHEANQADHQHKPGLVTRMVRSIARWFARESRRPVTVRPPLRDTQGNVVLMETPFTNVASIRQSGERNDVVAPKRRRA